MKTLSDFIYAILAGLCISMGGVCFLTAESRVAGALFFTLGLFIILLFGFNLFTGKVCYVFDNPPRYIFTVLYVWVGNLAGTTLAGYGLRQTRLISLAEKAEALCETKLNDSLVSIFILAILCNILIYLAVEGYKNAKHDLGRYLAVFLGVSSFVLCGFEHCVANMFYFSMANAWSGRALLYLLVMTLGNACGGVLFPLLRRLHKKYNG